MALKVLLLTQWFEPEPTFKGLTFAKALREMGLEVEVLTGFPNYPTGKLYPGYKIKLLEREEIDGVKVVRVPLYPSHDRSVLHRSANYLSFAFSAFVYSVFFCRRFDVVYAYHPPLTVGAVAVALKVLRGSNVVLDIQDLWPDTLKATGMLSNDRILLAIGKIAGWIYRWCDRVVVLSNGFKMRLISRGVNADKIEVIRNWADEKKIDEKNDCVSLSPGSSQEFCILFAGNIGSAQGLDVVLDAAVLLKKRGSKVRFVFLGTGLDIERLKMKSSELALENVSFLMPVPMEEVGSYLRAADALLVHLKRDDLFKITIPSKTQAYMAAGRPILMAVQGEASDLVRDAACGLFADSEDPLSLANTAEIFEKMSPDELDAMGRNGASFYKSHLSLDVGAAKFKKVFEDAVQKCKKKH